eukprot:6488124-Amphidinium_carterae.1
MAKRGASLVQLRACRPRGALLQGWWADSSCDNRQERTHGEEEWSVHHQVEDGQQQQQRQQHDAEE